MKASSWTIKSVSTLALLLASAALATVTMAADKTAHQVAEDVKNQMVSIIADRVKIEEKGEGKYFEAVQGLFEPVVDFNFIALGVMGKFSKEASNEQKQQFAELLKGSLMNTVSTYTKGLAGSGEYKIDVVPPKNDVTGKKSVNVGLEVHTAESVNRLAFTMRMNKDAEWKIANMTLNGINLGVTFRAQFAQAVKKAEGNIDAAIKSWSS